MLIIKNLKSKSPAEVADIFNVSKRQVERIRKCYQETWRRPRQSGRPRKTTAQDNSLLVRLIALGGVDTSDACLVKNCTSDSCSQWSPWSYCCPETSAKQETAKKPCCVRQGPQPDGRVDSRKLDFSDESSVELHPKRRQYCQRLSGARLDPRFTQKSVKFGGGKIMVWSYIQYRGARETCRVDGNIDSAKYHRFLPPSTFPTTRFFNGMELLAHTSGSTMKFLRGKKIKVLQGFGKVACKVAFHAIPNDFINKLYDSLPNLMATVLQAKGTPYKIVITYSPWWNTRLIFSFVI